MNYKFSRKLTWLSFFMTMGIVQFHNVGYHNLDIIQGGTIERVVYNLYIVFSDVLSYLGIGYFFLVSGFLMYRDLTVENVLGKVRKRFNTLGIPLVLWNTLAIAYRTLMDRKTPFSGAWEFLARYTLEPQDSPLWYVFVLLVFSCLAPALVRVFQKRNLSIVVLVLVTATSFWVTGLGHFKWLMDLTIYYRVPREAVTYLPMYLVGAFFGVYYSKQIIDETYLNQWVHIFGWVLFVAGIAVAYGVGIESPIGWWTMRFMPFACWFMVRSRGMDKEVPKLFRSSFFIYALHQPFVLPIIDKLYYGFWISRGSVTMYGAMLLRLLATIGVFATGSIEVLLARCILNPKLFKALSGGRVS